MLTENMQREANVIIVGGGVVGLSCAWELARAGVEGIVVFDKYGPASGTTGGSAGVVCPVDLGDLYVVMSLLGFADIKRLVADTGLSFTTAGSLRVVYDDDPEMRQKEALTMCEAYGGGSGSMLWPELLSVEAVEARLPWIRRTVRGDETRRVTGGILYPNQGFVNPFEVVRTYEELLRATTQVQIAWCNPVVGIRRKSDRVSEVITRRGVWSGERVINAGGPWGRKVAAMAGVDIPLTPQRIQVCVAEQKGTPVAPLTGVPDTVLGEGVWCRGEEGGMLLFGQHHHTTRAGFTVDPDYVNRINDAEYPRTVQDLYNKYWSVGESEFFGGWSCVYGTTTDGYPIVCRDERVDNLFHALGMNGHGITVHPAVARLMKSLVVEGEAHLVAQDLGGAVADLDGTALQLGRAGLAG